MCYSAQIEHQLKSLLRRFPGARIDYPAFRALFRRRLEDTGVRIAKAIELSFHQPETREEREIKDSIDLYHAQMMRKWETELFGQRKRLADAQRKLATKETKKAREDERIATDKIDWYVRRLADLRRTEPRESDSRIFPFWHAPVAVAEDGGYVIKPMRYHCRPAGKPASYDRRFDGLYNARRDNLEGFWKNLFGRRHAVAVMRSFYENVALHDYEKRALRDGEPARNLVLHFNPSPPGDMLVACLWDRWEQPGEPALYSFAAITDEPPPEVAATGHERCVIPLKPENLPAWLTPEGKSLSDLYRLLDDRERPYYAHRIAA